MNQSEVSIEQASAFLKESKSLFAQVFAHGTLVVEYYKPDTFDHQQPHERDEIYVIAKGTGIFYTGERRIPFKAGDFLFVPAGQIHRFENFSDNFATWVFFFGPVGGEK